jgi:hypothetical protein
LKSTWKRANYILKKAYVFVLVTFIILNFTSLIFETPYINHLISMCGLILLLSALFLMKRNNLIIPGIILGLSFIVIMSTSSNPISLWDGLREMKDIIPLVTLVVMIGWIIKYKPYVKALLQFTNGRMKTNSQFFLVTNLVSHLLSIIMSVVGIAFAYQLLNEKREEDIDQLTWDFTLSTAIMRGYSLTALWAIVHPAFAFVLAGTKAPLILTILEGFGLAVLGVTISLIAYRFQMDRKNRIKFFFQYIKSENNILERKKLIIDFIVWISIIIGTIFAFYQLLHISILTSIPLAIVIIVTIYFIVKKDMNTYFKQLENMINIDFLNKKDQVAMILSAGILVSALKVSGVGALFFNSFLTGANWLHIDMLLGLSLIVILLGLIGLPPVPAMVLLSGLLIDLPSQYPMDLITLALLLGVSISVVISPISTALLVMSSLNGRSTIQNGMYWNIFFGLLLLICGQLYFKVLLFIK